MKKTILINLVFICLVVCIGCASGQGKIKFPYTNDYLEKGEYAEAFELLAAQRSNKYSEYNLKNEISYTQDRGYLAHYAGDYEASNEYLQEAERLIDEAITESVSQRLRRVSRNDPYKVEYRGEEHEDIYLNVFTALNYYHQGKLENAQVEIRKLNDKMKFIKNKYEDWLTEIGSANWRQEVSGEPTYYYESALAGYLGMLF